MADKALMIIQIIIQDIARSDNERLVKHLKLIPVKQLPAEKITDLLVNLLQNALQNNNGVAVPILIDYFDTSDSYDLPLLNYILMNQGIEDEIAIFVLEQFPDLAYSSIVEAYINYDDIQDVIDGLIRLNSIRGPQSKEVYRDLLNKAREKNLAVAEYISTLLAEVEDYAIIPSWIIPAPPNIEPEIEPGNFSFANVTNIEEIVDILTSGMAAAGKSQEEIEDTAAELRSQLAGTDLSFRKRIIDKVLLNYAKADLSNEVELFRRKGPVNLIYDEDLTDSAYGGPRMLTYIDQEDFMDPEEDIVSPEEQEEQESTNWFIGYCESCLLRIRKPSHAIRVPLNYGGWKGCYCSADCIRNDYDDPLTLVLLDQTIIDLNKIGIYDL